MEAKDVALFVQEVKTEFPDVENETVLEIQYKRIRESYVQYQLITDKACYIRKAVANQLGSVQEEALTMAFNNVQNFTEYSNLLSENFNISLYSELSQQTFTYVEFPEILGESTNFLRFKYYSDVTLITDVNEIVQAYTNICNELISHGFYISLPDITNFLKLSNNKILYVEYESIVPVFADNFKTLIPNIFINSVNYTDHTIYYRNQEFQDLIDSFKSIFAQLSQGQVELIGIA